MSLLLLLMSRVHRGKKAPAAPTQSVSAINTLYRQKYVDALSVPANSHSGDSKEVRR